MRNLQSLSKPQRRFIFLTGFVGVLLLLVLAFAALSFNSLNSAARTQGVALSDDVNVRPFAALPDNDAFPSSVTVGPDGTIYTGSFASGAIWAISEDGNRVTEIPGTREGIGAVWSLAVTPDNLLLALDVRDTDPRTGGGRVVAVESGAVRDYAAIPDERGFVAPNDLAVAADGTLFVTDGGRNEVWRFTGSEAAVWWTPPAQAGTDTPRAFLTGLAYDGTRDALIITDPETNTVYRVARADSTTEILYQHGNRDHAPGFHGAVVTENGTLYVAAFGQNGIARVENGELIYVAGLFRGSNDVAAIHDRRLLVTNFDQSALILPLIAPQLPFEIDVIELGALPTPTDAS